MLAKNIKKIINLNNDFNVSVNVLLFDNNNTYDNDGIQTDIKGYKKN